MENKQLYIAYGSNINLEQMAFRCPNSKVVGTSEIKDFKLEFRGVATIVPKENASVPVLIWELDERDLPILNRYEGWPRLYRQEKMEFELNGKTFEGMAYLMNYGKIALRISSIITQYCRGTEKMVWTNLFCKRRWKIRFKRILQRKKSMRISILTSSETSIMMIFN